MTDIDKEADVELEEEVIVAGTRKKKATQAELLMTAFMKALEVSQAQNMELVTSLLMAQKEEKAKEKEAEEKHLKEEKEAEEKRWKEEREDHLKRQEALEAERREERRQLEVRWAGMLDNNATKRADDLSRETEREARRQRREALPKFKEGEDIELFLIRFEDALVKAGEPENEWVPLLQKNISGAPANILASSISEEARDSFSKTKEELLDALGKSLANTLETFFQPYKALNAYPGELGLRGKSLIRRLLKDAKSKEECEWLLLKAYISMCYSAECIQHINRMNPQSEAQLYADINSFEHCFGNATRIRFKPRSEGRQWHENRDRFDSRDRYEHKDRRYENKDRWESELKKEKSEYKDRTEWGSYDDKHR